MVFEIIRLVSNNERALRRGCTVEAFETPSGSSPFVDDMALHSDGPDAIPAMCVLINAGGAFTQWLDLLHKFYICGANLADALLVATDSITLHGSQSRILQLDAKHKHLAHVSAR